MHKLMHLFNILALAAFVTITPACDSSETNADAEECPAVNNEMALALVAPPDAPPPADLAFREQGPPAGIYITKISNNAIKRANVVKLIMSADGQPDPDETCTLSWYQPDTAKDERVMGLGCSMTAPLTLWQHYHQVFSANPDAKPLP